MAEPNVLLLDEPTNDLDIDTLQQLEDLLDGWPGTLVVVTHDRYLVERVCDTVVALLGDGRLADLPGGIEEYLVAGPRRCPVDHRRRLPRRPPCRRPGRGHGARRSGAPRARRAGWSGGWTSSRRARTLHEQLAAAATDYRAAARAGRRAEGGAGREGPGRDRLARGRRDRRGPVTALLLAHLVAAVLAPVLVRWWGRTAFLVLALVPAAGLLWTLPVDGRDRRPRASARRCRGCPRSTWPSALRLDTLSLHGRARQRRRRAGAGLLPLVLRPGRPRHRPVRRRCWSPSPARCSAWSSPTTCSLLYVFWELTTVFSYLLIGHNPALGGEPARGACRR